MSDHHAPDRAAALHESAITRDAAQARRLVWLAFWTMLASVGAVFGAVCQLVWPSFGVIAGALLGAPFAAIGMALGGPLGATLTQPTARRSLALALVSLLAPFAGGALDLALRLRTPWG